MIRRTVDVLKSKRSLWYGNALDRTKPDILST